MNNDTRYWLLMLLLVPLGIVTSTVALCGWITILAPHEPSCPPPAHVTGGRS